MHTFRMNLNAIRSGSRGDEPETYWRRRFIALAAGIATLGLFAWACSGAVNGGSPRPAAAITPVASGGLAARPATPATGASLTPSASASAGSSSRPRSHPGRSLASRRPSRAPGRVATCPAGGIVISVFASKSGYGPGELPRFEAEVVSTGRQACTFNLGPRFLRLMINTGDARIWDSADCAGGTGSGAATLRRGVPAAVHISWDRQVSAPGCRPQRARASAATYVAVAYSGKLASRPVTFVLRSPAAGLAGTASMDHCCSQVWVNGPLL